MNTDIIVAFACAAVSAAALAYLLVRGLLGSAAAGQQRPGSSIRMLLAPIAHFFEGRRGRDLELNRTLERFEKLVVQSGGKFLDGATAGEVLQPCSYRSLSANRFNLSRHAHET